MPYSVVEQRSQPFYVTPLKRVGYTRLVSSMIHVLVEKLDILTIAMSPMCTLFFYEMLTL